MHVPDRPRSLELRSAACAACTLPFLALSACGPGGADTARVARLEQRVGALEKRASIGAPAATGQPSAATPSAAADPPDTSTYQPGTIAVVHPAPTNIQALSEPSTDSVGGFVYTGGPLTLHDLSAQGVRYTGLAGVELQGWLKATQAGRYQIGEDLHGRSGGVIVGATCVLELWLEDRVVGSQQSVLPPPSGSGEERASLVVGADLQPGLYKLRLWTACTTPTARGARITADLLMKAPSDLNLRGIKPDELLHRPT